MGNREDLLAAAKHCLYEKGYARTTARDIRDASGVSLAGIGYHFGSKDALMQAALLEATGEWGDEIAQALAEGPETPTDPALRFEATWDRVIASFATHRPLWVATFELFGQMDTHPEIRAQLAAVLEGARLGLTALFLGDERAAQDPDALAIGALLYALLTGMVTQWLIDPAAAPSAHELTRALGVLAADVAPRKR